MEGLIDLSLRTNLDTSTHPSASMSDVCYPSDKLSTQEPMAPATSFRLVRTRVRKYIWDNRWNSHGHGGTSANLLTTDVPLLTVTQWEWRWQLMTAPVSQTLHPLLKPTTCCHHRLWESPCRYCTVPMSQQRRHTQHDYEPISSLCLRPTQQIHHT